MERDMLPWMEPQPEEEHAAVATWTNNSSSNNNVGGPKNEGVTAMGDGNLPSFKSMLEGDWYMNCNNPGELLPNLQSHTQQTIGFPSSDPNAAFLMQPLDSSSFLPPPKSCFSPFFNANDSTTNININNNPFDNGFDLGSQSGFLAPFQGNQASCSPVLMGFSAQMGPLELSSNPEFTRAVELGGTGFGPMGVGEEHVFGGSGPSNALFSSKAKVLRPLQALPPVGVPPTLFQKRAARSGGTDKLGALTASRFAVAGLEELEKRRKRGEEREVEGGLNYDSDEVIEIGKLGENGNNGANNYYNANNNDDNNNNSNNNNDDDNGAAGGDHKGKKKGMPAKNLMAERRRRKKLNDRLYMLRSVVPKISKMDRASILGDAIDYLKELLQRINDLHNELESSSPGSSLPPPTSFHPVTPTLPTLPCRVKEELCPSSVPSPKNQSAKVEVKVREGRAVNIHMFCARRPGLLLSTMRALDNLGLDVQQAVISCFNGFALDVFRAEQCREGQDVLPEQIKAVLLDTAGFQGMM